MAICEICGTDYPSKRADSKTCSPACRKAASRLSVTEISELSGTSLSVTEPQSMYRKCWSIPGFGTPTCQCRMCQGSADPSKINHGPYIDANDMEESGFTRNRVSLPGDPDYTSSGYTRVGDDAPARHLPNYVPTMLTTSAPLPA